MCPRWAHRPYEFGAKVAVAVTNQEGFVLASKSLEGNPYAGHTLKASMDQVIAMTGVSGRLKSSASPRAAALFRADSISC
jgi:hypothetical protein